MNKLLLRLALLPAGLWQKAGADVVQLQALLEVKLKMDDRKPLNFGRQQSSQKKNRRFTSILGIFFSFITGLIYIFPLLRINDPLLALTLFFTLFLGLLTFTLITDFSNVLIDTRDKYIVLPRPVNDRTLALSRMLHVGIYLFRIVLPMSIPGWITLGLLYGWRTALWFPMPLMLLLCTSLFLVMGVYMLMLRLSSASRFKDLLSYFQIAFSIVLFAFYYLIPRMIDSSLVTTLKLSDYPWTRYLPSFWLAATWSWIQLQGLPASTLLYSIPAVLLPALLIWATLKWLAPHFTAALGSMDGTDTDDAIPAARSKKTISNGFAGRIASLLNRREEAQAGFLMTWLQTARSRSFKLRIYPVFAYVPIYFVYLLSLNKDQSLSTVWASLPQTGKHITLLYMSCVVVLQALGFGAISEQYKAAWVYYAVPLSEPGAIMAGSFKAMWVKYFLPFFAVISAFVLVVWGQKAVLDIALALVNVTLFAVCTVRVAYRQLPFSQAEQNGAGSKVLRVFVSLAIPGTLGVGHYLALELWWLKALYLVLSGILLWLVWDSYAHTAWDALKRSEK